MLISIATIDCGAQWVDEWRVLGNLGVPRHHHSAAYIGAGRIIVLGGFINSSGILDGSRTESTEIIDVEAGTLTPGPPMQFARAAFTVEIADDGDVIVFGGSDTNPHVERLDVETMTWRYVGRMTSARWQHVTARIFGSYYLVVGGWDNNTAEIFDVATGTTRNIRPFIAPANSMKALLPAGRFPTFWGYRTGGPLSARSDSSYWYDPYADRWRVDQSFGVGVAAPSVCRLDNGSVFAVGGVSAETPVFTCSKQSFVLAPDGKLVPGPDALEGRQHHGVEEISTDILIVAGGLGDTVAFLRSTEIVDLKLGSTRPGPELIAPHSFAPLVQLPYRTGSAVVMISGFTGSNNTPLVEILSTECSGEIRLVPTNFRLRGSARVEGNAIQLTGSTTYQSGAAWIQSKIKVSPKLDIRFGFTLSGGDDNSQLDGGPQGADGLALIVQNEASSALGETGRGIGYDYSPHGVAVEFDAYNNAAYLDPSSSHVAIQVGDGTILHAIHEAPYTRGTVTEGIPPFVADGRSYHARVLYQDQRLQVWVSRTPELGIAQLAADIDLERELQLQSEGSAWIGFTSSTGFSSQIHTLDYVSVLGCDAVTTSVDTVATVWPNLHAFPTPASALLNVDLATAAETADAIQLLDAMGNLRSAYTVPAGSINAVIDVSSLPSGLYVLLHKQSDSIAAQTLITILH